GLLERRASIRPSHLDINSAALRAFGRAHAKLGARDHLDDLGLPFPEEDSLGARKPRPEKRYELGAPDRARPGRHVRQFETPSDVLASKDDENAASHLVGKERNAPVVSRGEEHVTDPVAVEVTSAIDRV